MSFAFLFRHIRYCAFSALFFVGCGSLPPSMTRFSQTNEVLSFDDPAPIYKSVFRTAGKGDLETTQEYQQRVNALGISGRRVTFLISPQDCEVMAYPDNGFFVIATRDSFSSYDSSHMYEHFSRAGSRIHGSITIAAEFNFGRERMGNAFGAQVDVTTSSRKCLMLRLEGFDRLDRALRWRRDEKDSSFHFGLPFKTADLQFRELLKSQCIGLAVQGVIGDVAQSLQTTAGLAPAFDSPVSIQAELQILPFRLETAWIINTTNNTTVAKWSAR